MTCFFYGKPVYSAHSIRRTRGNIRNAIIFHIVGVRRRLVGSKAHVRFSARHSMEVLLLLFSYYFAYTKYTSEDILLLRSSIIRTQESFLNGSETQSLITLR